MQSVVLSRLSIIISSSLAQNKLNGSVEGFCSDPCSELQSSVSHGMVLAPLAIALLFYTIAALPVLLCRSRYRVYGVKSCLWVLIELWVHLVMSHSLFHIDRVQAYVWALHASAFTLSKWQPRKGVPYPGLHKLASLAGVWGIGLFAWQLGPSVGLAAWHSHSDAQCGWKVHLTSVVGVEVLGLGLGLMEGVVIG
jgi:hypothetical protein